MFFINHISKCSGPPPLPPILFDQSLNILFQRIFIKLDVSYASQHTFSKVTVTIFENYIYIVNIRGLEPRLRKMICSSTCLLLIMLSPYIFILCAEILAIDLFGLYILFSQYRSCDNTQGAWSFVLFIKKSACRHIHIFSCKFNKTKPSILEYLYQIKSSLQLEKQISVTIGRQKAFEKKWHKIIQSL